MTDQMGAVRRLLSFATTEFGQYQSELLLSGYGAEQVVLRRDYRVSLSVGEGRREIKVKMATEDPAGLPARQEPLVLLALLRMLLSEDQPHPTRVSYSVRRMTKMLGWSRGEGRTIIEGAVERYYSLSVIKHEAVEGIAEEEAVNRKLVLRPIIEWEWGEETVGDNRLIVPQDSRVRFNPEFVEQLRERALLGIEWRRVSGLHPIVYV